MKIDQLFEIVFVASAILLIVLVLLHSPKGDGLGGIGGQAQLFTSAKSAETTLNRITWALGLIFLAAALVLSAGWVASSASRSPVMPAIESASSPAPPQEQPSLATPAEDNNIGAPNFVPESLEAGENS